MSIFDRIDKDDYPEDDEIRTALQSLVNDCIARYNARPVRGKMKATISQEEIEEMVAILYQKLDKFIPGKGNKCFNFLMTICCCLVVQRRIREIIPSAKPV